MRFLMLNWRDPFNPLAGGAERVSLAYLRALVERGHEAWWFAYAFPDGSAEDEADGVRVIRGGGHGTALAKARAWSARQAPFDLTIDQHHGIPWFAPWWTRGPCVSYIHEVLGPIWSAFYPWPLSALGRLQERFTHGLYRDCPFWTASAHTKRRLMAHGVKSVTTIPYGVDTQALTELPEKPLRGEARLICVSRLAPNKRVDHCVRALGVLRERGVSARLTIVGGGAEEGALRRLTNDLDLTDRVAFMGRLEEAAKDWALREAHLLLHASQREGWGLNVIESNAMGTPAVVYPVDGLVESTLHEKTGLVAKTETPRALADAVGDALSRPDDYQRWRWAAWRRAAEFHWSNVLPAACDWLETMARDGTGGTGAREGRTSIER